MNAPHTMIFKAHFVMVYGSILLQVACSGNQGRAVIYDKDWGPKETLHIDGELAEFTGTMDYRTGYRRIQANNGGSLIISPAARINNYTGTAQWTRELFFTGDPNSPEKEYLIIDKAFKADNSGFDPDSGQHLWQAKGFCQLTLKHACLITHSTASIPSMIKKYNGAFVPDTELNFLGESEWVVDSQPQTLRGTCRSWGRLTITTHSDLTVIPDSRIPNSRFGDRHITKRGQGTLHIAGRQFYYPNPPHLAQNGAAPVISVEQGLMLFSTDPFAYKTGEGKVACVAPQLAIATAGRTRFTCGFTLASLQVDGLLQLSEQGGRVAGDCRLSHTATLILSLPAKPRPSDAVLSIAGHLSLQGKLHIISSTAIKAGRYRLFDVDGTLTGTDQVTLNIPNATLLQDGTLQIDAVAQDAAHQLKAAQ